MLTRGLMVLLALGGVWPIGCAGVTAVTATQCRVNRERLEQKLPSPVIADEDAPNSASGIAMIQRNRRPAANPEDATTATIKLFDGPPRPLGLADVVIETLGNNRQLKIENASMRAAAHDVAIEQGIYDVLFQSSYWFSRQKEESTADDHQRSALRTHTGEISLGQLLPSGARLSVGYDLAREKAYDQQAWVRLSQPLLNGFGPAMTNANIRIARLGHEQSTIGFQAQVEQQLTEALNTYWTLIGAQEAFQVQVGSYNAALDLLRINRIKYRIGKVAEPDVLQAEAAAQARRDQLVLARKSVRLVEDRLKRQMLVGNGRPAWKDQIQPTQPIAWHEVQADLEESIELALERRAEIQQAAVGIDQAAIAVQVARNRRWPELDLFAEGAAHGANGGFGHSLDRLAEGRSNNYAAGLEISYPLQNRAARHGYQKAQVRQEQAEEIRRDVEDRIIQEVRQALLELEAGRERIELTRVLVENEEAKLNAERRRYDLGASTAYQVIQFQNDLASARMQYVGAVIDYNQAAIEFERVRGTLLDSYGVELVGDDTE